MTDNRNGILEVRILDSFEERIGGLTIGQVPTPLTVETTAQITIRQDFFTSITLAGVESIVTFFKETRDSDPESPNFGSIITRTPISTQPLVTITGANELVEEDPELEPLSIPIWFLTPRNDPPGSDPWDREGSSGLSSYTLGITVTFSGILEAGNFQGDLWFVSGTDRIARLIISVTILDTESMLSGFPGTVWFHEV